MGSVVKWGVIGAGGIADRRTIPEGIVPAANSELVAVMDVDEARVKEVASKYNVPKWYTSDADLLKDPAVEAVYIATPVNVHVEQAVAAAEKGKHVLCEKPLALTLDESRRIIHACKSAGVKLSVGLMMRSMHATRRSGRPFRTARSASRSWRGHSSPAGIRRSPAHGVRSPSAEVEAP